jgi:hypothetical protein
MTRNKALSCLVVLLTLAPGLCAAQPPAPTPGFTISASNITMSSSNTSIPFTLTSVNGFTGSVAVSCTPPNPPAGVNEPECGNFGPATGPIVLTANGTATGAVALLAYKPLPTPTVSRLNHLGHGRGTSWALAGVLMLGLGSLRKRSRTKRSHLFTHLSLAVGMLIGLTGITACGGPETLTPGTYSYTLTATQVALPLPPNPSVSTTATVTVPAGIVVQPGPGPI